MREDVGVSTDTPDTDGRTGVLPAVVASDPGTMAHNGLHGPLRGTPERVAGSIRRTTNLDLIRPEGPDGPIRITGRGRDLRTAADGRGIVRATALIAATVEGDRVTALTTHPRPPGIADMVGRRAVVGWRTGLWRHLRGQHDAGTVLHLVLDDLPGGMIIGGFTRRRAIAESAGGPLPQPGRRLDVCAGWAAESRAAITLAQTGIPPAPVTPLAPDLGCDTDSLAWHTLPELPAYGISRRRRIDVLDTGEEVVAEAWFRDSFTDADGAHRVLHEYRVAVTADRGSYAVRHLSAHPRVLPHRECPVAAASAQRMRGIPLGQLRERVSSDLFGPESCTHLNDLLRSLADVPGLLALG